MLVHLASLGLALGVAVSVLTGCTLARLDVETRDHASSTVLVGRVEQDHEADGAIVVGAYAEALGRWQLVHQTLLHEHGGYEFIVPPGEYALFAFADRNGNGLFDAGEPAASHAGGRRLQTSGSGVVASSCCRTAATPPGNRRSASSTGPPASTGWRSWPRATLHTVRVTRWCPAAAHRWPRSGCSRCAEATRLDPADLAAAACAIQRMGLMRLCVRSH